MKMKTIGFCDIFEERSYFWSQMVSTLPISLINLYSGMSFGITTVMLPQLREDENITYDASHESWIASVVPLAMIIGSLICGQGMDQYGRRPMQIFTSVPFVIGGLIIACAPSTGVIIVGTFFTGISAGSIRVLLVYIGETKSPNIRAVALLIPCILLSTGTILSHIFGYYLSWKISVFISIIPACLVIVCSLFLKESPIWLIAKGKTDEGIQMFRWFRGTDVSLKAKLEAVIERQSIKTNDVRESLKILRSKVFIKPMLTLLVVMMSVQFSGVNFILYYAQDIFRDTFSGEIDPIALVFLMDCILGVVNTTICLLGKYVSKRKSFITSNYGLTIFSCGLIACLIAVSHDSLKWVSLLCLVLFLCFSTVIVAIGWTFVPELLPNSVRGIGTGLSSAFSYMFLFCITKLTPDYIKRYGAPAVFAFCGVSTLICGTILCFVLPETHGKTLQSIEDNYQSKPGESDIPL